MEKLLILCLLSLLYAQNIIGTTYDFNGKKRFRQQQDNDSILLFDSTGKIQKKEVVGEEVFLIDTITLQNNDDGCLYFMQINKEIHQVDCTTLQEKKEPIPHGVSLTHIGFDNKKKCFFGISQVVNNEIVVVYRGGSMDIITDFDDECGVQIGSNTYDEDTNQYIVSCSNDDHSYLIVDVEEKKVVKTIKVDDLLDAVVVYKGNIVGISNSSIVMLNIKDPSKGFEKLIDFKIGISNNGGALDKKNGVLYISFTDYEKQFFAAFDLEKKSYKKYQVFDTLMNIQFIEKR